MSKTSLRIQARTRLRALTTRQRIAAGDAIAERIWTLPQLADARTLLLYASLPEEVPTGAIAEEAVRRGITITYPRCLPETRAMALHVLRDLGDLRDAGNYGISEPDPACPLIDASEIDCVLVPGLAWDRRGGRLGRGAGYYDRIFATECWRGFRCGVFFAVQEVELIPTDPWDVPMDGVVTEEELWLNRVMSYEL